MVFPFELVSRHAKLLFAFVSILFFLSGCAVQPKSQAYQIDSSLGSMDVRDKESLEDHQKDSVLGSHGVAIASSAYSDITYGSVGLTGFSYEGLASALIVAGLDMMRPPKASEKTWIVGRISMEESQSGRELHEEIFSTYDKAFTDTLAEFGVEYEIYESENSNAIERGHELDLDEFSQQRLYIVIAPDFGCDLIVTEEGKRDSTCAAWVYAGGLETQIAPMEHPLAGEKVWRVDEGMRHNIRFVFGDGAEAMLPTMDIHREISKKLPGWAYMFMPDSTEYVVINKNGEAAGYPYFLNNGDELHFISPEVEGE